MSVYQENRRGREGGKEREVKRCRGAAIGTSEWHRTIVGSERTCHGPTSCKVYDASRVAEGERKELKGNKENRIGLGG